MSAKSLGDFFARLIATVLFIGYLPLMPGTFGSAAGVYLFYLLGSSASLIYFTAILITISLGFLTSGRVEKVLNKKDPGIIVIDEVAGMLITLSFMPQDIRIVFLGFLFFRILDTLKPFPIGRIQHLRGAFGVMSDDLIAGIYSNLLLQLVLNFASFKIS